VDCAYQGFASGDLDRDAAIVRKLLATSGREFFVAQSFAKNMGLYGERIGMLHVVCDTSEISSRVLSQLKLVIRPMYSSPPLHGARIIETVLGNPKLRDLWTSELKVVAGRIAAMRLLFKQKMEATTGISWSHVTDQIGMFSYTGISEKQVDVLINQWHIYLLKSGRISLAGLNDANIDYVVDAFADVVANHS
jgi:aspartate aminotransferase